MGEMSECEEGQSFALRLDVLAFSRLCAVSKPWRVKGDMCRKSRPNFAIFEGWTKCPSEIFQFNLGLIYFCLGAGQGCSNG